MLRPMFKITGSGFGEALKAVELLSMPPELRRRVTGRVVREALKRTRRNIREQRSPEGAPWAPRKGRRDKRGKMLRRLARSRVIRAWYDENAGKLDYPNAGVNRIALKHQRGSVDFYDAVDYPRPFDGSKVPVRLNRERGENGCSANQAVMLIRLDHLPPKLRSAVSAQGTTAAVRTVMRHISAKQAGFLIGAKLARTGRKRLPAVTPARPFLGVADRERAEIVNFVFDTIDQTFTRGRKSSK